MRALPEHEKHSSVRWRGGVVEYRKATEVEWLQQPLASGLAPAITPNVPCAQFHVLHGQRKVQRPI